MGNLNEREYIDFDQMLRDIQEENQKKLKEILNEPISNIPFETIKVEQSGSNRLLRIVDIFIPPGAK